MSLPSGYKRLEYIQSTGIQYIDTGFKPTGSTKVVCDFQMLSQGSSQQGVFGSRPGISGRFTVFTGNQTSDLQVDYNTEQTLARVGSSITGLNVNSRTTLEVSNSLIINGTTVKTVSAVSFTSTYNLFLFANNNVGTAQLPGVMKLYSCQIYDNGTLVRDFIPCKNTGGAVGLWDDVNMLFYGNAGTGAFTAGPVIAIAINKSEITELEYIQSSGTQYINTSFKPNQDTRVVMDVDLLANTAWVALFGARDAATTKEYSVITSSATAINSRFNTSGVRLTVSTVIGRYLIDKNKALCLINSFQLKNTSSTFQPSYSMYLFAQNNGGVTWGAAKVKLYYCKVYDNGTLVRDFIPCIKDDGTVGIYDKLHGLLYINMGTGSFVAGPVKVSPLNLPVNIGGTWKNANEVFVNIGGTWKAVEAAFVNIGGTWKELG